MNSEVSTDCSDACFPSLTQKIYVSSPVMSPQNKSHSIWRCSMMSGHICMRCSFWPSFSCFGTIFVQNFPWRKSSKLCLFFLVKLTCDHTNSQETIVTHHLSRSTLISDLLVEELSLLELSFTSARPALNFLCCSKTRVRDMTLSKACDWVFLKQTKKITRYSVFIVRSSVLIAERTKTEKM